MIVGIKDGLKLLGISIVIFCAVFVCTFFINFYVDAQALETLITDENIMTLYKAQMATAQFTCAISGGFLGLIAVVMLIFYIKLYIDGNLSRIGLLKAMGYTDVEIALRFGIFGLSVLVGAALGFGGGHAIMPTVYEGMAIKGLPEIAITFHPGLMIAFVFAPALLFSLLACVFAYFTLKMPLSEMLRGKSEKIKRLKQRPDKDRSFLRETCLKTLFGKKSLVFFIAFAGFCFSSMVQMSASMLDLSSETMGAIILAIGIVLAVTTMFMAVTTLVNGNVKNISMMKAFGYTLKECTFTVLGGYHLFAVLGFGVGTVYQFGILSLMLNIVFKDVGDIPEYSFDVPLFFITLAVFIVFYEVIMLFYTYKINRISVKEVMGEN